MTCRLYLAALHLNEYAVRTQSRIAVGELQFKIHFPKARRGEHIVSIVKTSYTTEYVRELMDLLFNKVIHDPAQYLSELKAMVVPDFLCSQYERPVKQDAIGRHVPRFSSPGGVGTTATPGEATNV